MKRFVNGKLAAALLAIALTLAASLAAFAAWPSFQNDPAANNGVVTVAPPITTPGSVVRVGLTTNDPPELNPPYPPEPSSVFAGIDTESVIGNGYIYTLYNGGVSGANATGGARLGITNLLTGVSNNIQLDATANNISQLSTPYYYEPAGSVVALTTRSIGSGYAWSLYGVLNPTTSPVVTQACSGDWQATTPISAYTHNGTLYLYFGTWSYDNNEEYEGIGDGAYYQYDTSLNELTKFTPPVSDDFYGAGAAIVTASDGKPYVVFGSDGYGSNRANVYVRPVGVNFANDEYGNTIPMDIAHPNDKIRSSMAHDTESAALYFTSREAESEPSPVYDGLLWKLPVSNLMVGAADLSQLAANVPLSNASTSTPVISPSGYVYVGTYNSFTSGTVETILHSNIGSSTINMTTIYTGDPVQASPIVYSVSNGDYVYFTTNSGSGKGYCYRFNGSTIQSRWSAGGTSGNPYAEQGFASDNGYLVYGDDSNTLYIMH